MPNGKTYWVDHRGSKMWVVDPGSTPPARNLQTGEYASKVPSGLEQFTPSGSYIPGAGDTFPYASQYIPGFPEATGSRKPAPPAIAPGVAPMGAYDVPIPSPSDAIPPSAVGEVPPLNPDDFYVKWDDALREYVPARPGESGAVFDDVAYSEAAEARKDVATGFAGAGGRTGPTAAELEIQKSQVQAQNLATFISGTVAALEAEIDAGRLETEQAIGEFNRQMDAFAEAGEQLEAIQPYTIPTGAEYAPGFGPGEIGERLGIKPRKAQPVRVDPFAQAAEIVRGTPTITDVGAPSLDPLQAALEAARGFAGV